MRLRTHLVVLVLAALVPVLLFAVLLVRENARLQLAATERGMRETAHAVASAVDKTLDGAITTLEARAESDYLDAPDLRAFHPLCQRSIALLDERGDLSLRYTTGESAMLPTGFVIERGRGLGGLVLATGEPVRTDDIAADPRFADDPHLDAVKAAGIVACMVAPITTAGVVVGVIYANNHAARPFTADDETALVALAAHAAVAVQKARLLAAEHAARAEAEAASRGKDELLAMLGHELRNPLAAIANAVAVLDGTAGPAARRARDIIARQNGHLARLVDDLLDVARVTSGKIALVRRPLQLDEAVRRGIGTPAASGRVGPHQVALHLEPVWAHVDETRFEQIVTNLVGNAAKFTPPGGAITVSLQAADGEAVLQVRDAGAGIDPEMLPRVFDLFVQGGGPATPGESRGLGLGLTLVWRIAELHGGRVTAFSDGPGHGSTFTVWLPALSAMGEGAVPASARAASPGELRRRRIVVVEDNADAREMLRQALELAGHEVHEADDGFAGIEMVCRLRPDVALIDVGLPGLDGYAVARSVREAEVATRLIALTGYGQPDDRRRALAAGFDAHLVKPVEPETLLGTLEDLVNERRA